jgi:hypothetical protein
VHSATGGGAQRIAPNEDQPVRSLVLVSESPFPPSNSKLPEDLEARLDIIGQSLGDASPSSSRTRAARLLTSCSLDAGSFGAKLDEAARTALAALPAVHRRDAVGSPNGMPYCFAVLEALVEDRQEPPVTRARHGRQQSANRRWIAPVDVPVTSVQADEPCAGHPLWPSVLETLAGTLAPSVFTHRVKPLRSRAGDDGALEIVAPDGLAASWITSQLGRRIQEALEGMASEAPIWRVIT